MFCKILLWIFRNNTDQEADTILLNTNSSIKNVHREQELAFTTIYDWYHRHLVPEEEIDIQSLPWIATNVDDIRGINIRIDS